MDQAIADEAGNATAIAPEGRAQLAIYRDQLYERSKQEQLNRYCEMEDVVSQPGSPATAAVALCFDAHYAGPASVLIHSLGRHWRGTTSLTVCCVVDDSVGKTERAKIAFAAERASVSLTIRQIKTPALDTRFPHLSPMSWARLELPALLARDYEIVLYLDSDMLACTSVHPLLRRLPSGTAIAAVRDYCIPELGTPHLAACRFTVVPSEEQLPYFNSGLLLIDTAEWTRQRITERLADVLATETGPDRLLFGDQDILNAAVRGRFELLDPRWNVVPLNAVRTVLDFDYHGEVYLPERYLAFLEADPWILHYATRLKPWSDTYPETPIRQLWRAEAAQASG